MDAKKKVEAILSTTASVPLIAAGGKQTLYTVPVGKKAVVTAVVIRQPSLAMTGGSDFDLGDGASADTWKETIDLSGLATTVGYTRITNDNANIASIFDAGDVFGIFPSTGTTAAALVTIEVFGYEWDV